MTEEEWLSGSDLAAMLEYVRDKSSNRKQRLFACGCCREVWGEKPPEAVDRAIKIGEGGFVEEANRPVFDELLQEGRVASAAGDSLAPVLLLFAGSCLLDDPLFL